MRKLSSLIVSVDKTTQNEKCIISRLRWSNPNRVEGKLESPRCVVIGRRVGLVPLNPYQIPHSKLYDNEPQTSSWVMSFSYWEEFMESLVST